MKLLNHIYTSQALLKTYIQKNRMNEEKNILIQFFSAIYEKKELENLIDFLKSLLPQAKIIGTTTSHEISEEGLHNNETIISFSLFRKTIVETYLVQGEEDSFKTGQNLINSLKEPTNKDIKTAICFSNGIVENGEELLNGINSINSSIVIAGGMAGDYVNYGETYIFTENGITTDGAVLATLKNPDLIINTNHSFNWDTIGKKHLITKSVKNRVYTIDNKKAIDFYKYYLGDDIEDNLIEICLGLPLIIEKKNINIGRGLVKLHTDGSISFAGNMLEGSTIRFGYGNTSLILEKSKQDIYKLSEYPIEGIYIYSCVGRKKAFMSESIDIEIERYNTIAPMTGFLTHGEFFHGNVQTCKSRLLNITMTLLAISEEKKEKNKKELKLSNAQKELRKSLALNQLISRTSLELDDLTQNLEKRVNDEILKNEEKDRLINITQAQAEVGSMLEMIAHQWRQPLSAISSTASAIQIKSEVGDLDNKELESLLDEILELSSFASQTIEDFRTLFKEKQRAEFINIESLIIKLKTILKSLISHNYIKIEEEYICSKEEDIFIPLGQTLQVLINIVKNAVDAIVENKIKNPLIKFTIKKDDDFHKLFIEDNAGGIAEEYLPKIFDTRFSTKGGTHGTGIGLDICKSIIEKNLNGSISASNGKEGAIFEIKIPISKKAED